MHAMGLVSDGFLEAVVRVGELTELTTNIIYLFAPLEPEAERIINVGSLGTWDPDQALHSMFVVFVLLGFRILRF